MQIFFTRPKHKVLSNNTCHIHILHLQTGAAPPVEGEDASSLEAHQQWLCAESESWCLTKARLIFERMRLPANGYMR